MPSDFSDKIKQVILHQLSMGATCRIHLHRECCRELGFNTEPKFNNKDQRVRICKAMPDSEFDKPFVTLLEAEMIEKVADIGGFAFYKITQKQ